MKDANYWVKQLAMQSHPEGGYFKETYRSSEVIESQALPDRYQGKRNFATAIYYLLSDCEFSAFHRIKSDETWHFYQGSPLELLEITIKGELIKTILGSAPEAGMNLQYTIPAGHWFAAHVPEPDSYALLGCTVAPGFDFNDFEMANAEDLLKEFPHHRETIAKFCK